MIGQFAMLTAFSPLILLRGPCHSPKIIVIKKFDGYDGSRIPAARTPCHASPRVLAFVILDPKLLIQRYGAMTLN